MSPLFYTIIYRLSSIQVDRLAGHTKVRSFHGGVTSYNQMGLSNRASGVRAGLTYFVFKYFVFAVFEGIYIWIGCLQGNLTQPGE